MTDDPHYDDPRYDLVELARRMANMIRFGTIAEADYDAARVRMKSGDLLTGWLPFFAWRAGKDVAWWAPDIGEPCMSFAPDGELANAIVFPSTYSDAAPPPANTPDQQRASFHDGTTVTYDRAAHLLTVDLTASGGTVLVKANQVTVESPSIDLGGLGGPAVARIGDLVEVGAGSSAGNWPIVTGSDITRST